MLVELVGVEKKSRLMSKRQLKMFVGSETDVKLKLVDVNDTREKM